jgi:DNA replicative helicase MCM subunit Mcm2 (Cdc46/Mcm family)/transcriptional regulator with XRE-family HTH domain
LLSDSGWFDRQWGLQSGLGALLLPIGWMRMDLDLNELEKQGGESPFVGKFQSFFESQYQKSIERLAMDWPQKRSLFVNFSDLEHYDFELADQLLESPDSLNEAAEMAVQNIHVPVLETKEFKPHVRFFNLPKDRSPLLRNISAEHLGKLVAVEGVVRQLTDVLPKLQVAAWQCRRCGNVYKRIQESDRVSMPPMCECKHRDFDLLQEESTFIDNQKIQIQEPLEMLKGSEQATILDVIVSDDLVNKVMPGDRTRIVGVIRLRSPKEKNLVYGRFLEAVHLEETAKEFDEVEISPEEKKEIESLAKDPKIYELLGKSIAPNIYGHETVKEAIALQLFGGVKKILPNDTSIRGNIHCLLVGDPGCLVADERVVLGNGSIEKIGNLGNEHLQEIRTQVLTGEGMGKRDWATVFHFYPNQTVMEIVTESGKSIKGTPNHPLLCVSKENGRVKRSWKRLDEFRISDKVAVVASIPCTVKAPIPTGFRPLNRKLGPKFRGKLPEKVTPELGGLLGYLVGDGWVTRYKTGFVVNEQEKDLLPKLLAASDCLFGIRPVPRTRKLLEGRKARLFYSEIHSEDVAYNLSFLREKRVPDLVLRSGNAVASEFLKWLFEADGCCFCKGRGRRAVALKAKNIELLRDVQMLLLRFAVHSRITDRALQIRRGKDILKFAKKIGFASEKKKEKLGQLCKEAESFGRFNSQRSEKIVKIVSHPPEDVFDIEVPKGHRFIANGIVSHNTAKSQMLQAVNKIAPKSIYTAGKTSTGVGLTASAVKDDFGEGGWTLKAGALVLANGGLAMIDEFDKMECLTADALVCMENGELKPIGELFEELKVGGTVEKTERGISIRNVQNCFVLSMDKNLKLVKRRLLACHEYPYEGRILEVVLQSGETIAVSPNHPFFSSNSVGVRTVKAGLLKKGDFVFVPAVLPSEDTAAADGKKSRLFGYLAGDGNVTYNPPENYLLRFTNKDADLLDDFSSCCKNVFAEPVVFPSEVRAGGLACTRLSGREFVDSIAQEAPGLMEKFDRKFSPSMAFGSPENACHYLRALFDSEGSVDAKHHQVSFASTSKRLTMEVKALLLKNGILSQIRTEKKSGNRRTAYLLHITDRDSIGFFAQRIGFVSQRKQERLERILQWSPAERSIINVIPSIGCLLKEIRLELGLLQRQCGLNKITYNNFENGIANITVKKAKVVLASFQVRALQIAVSESTRQKVRFLETLVNGDIRWRKVKEVRETVPPFLPKFSYALAHRINSLLRHIGEKPVAPKKMAKMFPELRTKLVQRLEEIQRAEKEPVVWNALGTIMKKQFLSQFRLAREIRVNQSTLSRWIRQQVKAPPNALQMVSEVVQAMLLESSEKILLLLGLIEKTQTGFGTKIYDLTVESSHNFIANNILVHNSEDRSAMHEAMEQGMISVAKAGIVTRFKTDTTILAAANPKFARFDQYKNFLEQVDLPPTLISRFDLFFMIFDVLDRKKDEDIAQHILKTHQAGEMSLQRRTQGKKQKEVLEFEAMLVPAIPGELLKKYVAFARQNVFPVLTKEAIQAISDYYVDLRELGKKQGTYTATHRQLEGLVRLSEASARIRLSNTVEKEDTERAIRLLRTSLQELVTDKETGKLDIDMLTSGQSTSQTNQLKGVLGIVQRLNQEHDKVLLEQVFDEAQKMGLDKEKTREIISKLKRSGDLYEPSLGIIKPVPKEF